jgi:hypothetical protein
MRKRKSREEDEKRGWGSGCRDGEPTYRGTDLKTGSWRRDGAGVEGR